jgi:hypothetical protein
VGAALVFLIAAAVFFVFVYIVAYAIAGMVVTGYVAAKVAEKTVGKADPEAVGRVLGWICLVTFVVCVILIGILLAAESHSEAKDEYREDSIGCYGTQTRIRRSCEAAREYPYHPQVVQLQFKRCCDLPWRFDPCPVSSREWRGSYCPTDRPIAPDPGRFVVLSRDLSESMEQIRALERTETEMPSFLFPPELPYPVRRALQMRIADSKWSR